MADSSQKFIARNRAPRVQIEYDVELYGSAKKVQLPFVMGVMSDLVGKSRVEQPALADRKFLEIDVDNFDDRMRAMAPRAAFSVPNTLTGEGNLAVDLVFEKMDDFSPGAIAARIEPLRALLQARTELSNLMAYMDGKTGAEALIEKILADPALLSAISALPAEGGDSAQDSALASLRAVVVPDAAPDTVTEDALASLSRVAVADAAPDSAAEDALASLSRVEVADAAPDTVTEDALASLSRVAVAEDAPDSAAEDALASLSRVEVAEDAPDSAAEDALASLSRVAVAEEPVPEVDPLDDLLAEVPGEADPLDDLMAETSPESDPLDDLLADAPGGADPLDDLLADAPGEADPLDDLLTETPGGADPLDDLLADAPGESDPLDDLLAEVPGESDPLDDLLADAPGESDPLDDLLADAPGEADPLDDLLTETPGGADPLDDLLADAPGEADPLDDLLAEVPGESDPFDDLLADAPESDPLDDLLADAPGESDPLDDLMAETPPESDPLDDLLAEVPGGADPLDDLLADISVDGGGSVGGEGTAQVQGARMEQDPAFAFGLMGSARPDAARLNRKRFRIAIFGDFSGRAARGALETGDALAARRPIPLDPDTVEEVIAGFGTTLVLPIGREGAGVEVKLRELDDLHPDQLYENVALFSELVGLKQQLGRGATAASAAARLTEWAERHGTHAAPPKLKSTGNSVPADRRLSDFQKLIGDTGGQLTQASPVEEILARVVGPHIRAVPDADTVAMQGAVDAALSSAMRLVLHHPEFQSLEAQWRSIDLIARSIETDDTLDVMLYDVSAEEIAADLARADDLSASGLVRLLTGAPLDPETGRGGYSALMGLYTFEETPPHAELLGRIARVAAHVDAPFFAAMSPAFLEVDKKDRHPLVAQAWDSLREMPEARHLGLVTPRFMLRRPYGAKSDPIYEFPFEEFTMRAGLSGMLWANPVVLVAILLAKSFREHGRHMALGKIMSLGDIPYHFVTDRHGDQVQLPCTERNLTLEKVEGVLARGFMPVVSIKGRDEIRLASFQSVGGGEILGPWSDAAPPDPSPPRAAPPVVAGDSALDDLLAGFDTDAGAGDVSLDDIDADLAALLDDL